jgi:hypothetical protein
MKTMTFQFLPSGVHTIDVGFQNKKLNVTVEITSDTAIILNCDLQNSIKEFPKRPPVIFTDGSERNAALWPEKLFWKDGGVFCTAKLASGFKPTNRMAMCAAFKTDAEYKTARRGKIPNPRRGSKKNPAILTGLPPNQIGCIGTHKITSFKSIQPIE